MMNWKKERPLIGTEGFIKGLHPSSSTDCCFIQSRSQGMDVSMSDSPPRKCPQLDSFVQVGVPILQIVEGLLAQREKSK
jgi:hypothetical protein